MVFYTATLSRRVAHEPRQRVESMSVEGEAKDVVS